MTGAVGAVSGIWYVARFPGWAITYTIAGVAIIYVLTLYQRELGSSRHGEAESS